MVKLTIQQIRRRNNEVCSTSEKEFETLQDALKKVNAIDKAVAKEYHYFKYTIEDLNDEELI